MGTIVGARGYGIELRERIVKAVHDGENPNTVAQRFRVHRQTVDVYLIKTELDTLDRTRKPTGRPRSLTEQHETQVLKQLKEFSDALLEEHVQMLFKVTDFKTSRATIHRVFVRHGITFKKQSLLVSKRRCENCFSERDFPAAEQHLKDEIYR